MDDASPFYWTLDDHRRAFESGAATALSVLHHALERIETIDRSGPTLRSVIEINPDAEEIAAALDRERTEGHVRGPLHGVPVLLKDSIDTADRMQTTAGSLALVGTRRARDAHVAARLRDAGAVILGKTNMSEWANFRGHGSTSGWSGRGGQTRNPYALDRSPCGSSSGSAAAVSAGIVPLSVGTETDGSILCPGAVNGVVGVKPTVGLTSRAGVVPISRSQDTIGPFARTVADAALLLDALAGPDPADPATLNAPAQRTADYADALREDALRGARIGIPRTRFFGYDRNADIVAEAAIGLLRELGAEIVDPAEIPSAMEMRSSKAEYEVLLYEFKADFDAYLAHLGSDTPVRSLRDVIDFNVAHEDRELHFFGQEILEEALSRGSLDEPAYLEARNTSLRLSRTEGIDAAMKEHHLDALLMPTGGAAFLIDLVNGDAHGGGSSQPSAMAGYPAVTVPAGFAHGLPIGITFAGRAWSEATLLGYAHAFERAALVWQPPRFLATAIDPGSVPFG